MMVWYNLLLCPAPEGERVLVACRNKRGFISINIGYFTDGHFHGMGSNAEPTHWMTLPKPPKEGC